MYSKRKWIFVTTVMITMILGIAGCGKSTEDANEAEVFAVEAEDLPMSEINEEEEPKGEDADMQAPEQESGEDAQAPAEEEEMLHYINEDKDLYGDIWEVGDMQFTVSEIYRDTLEDGGEIMVIGAEGTEKESPKITVVYDENTKFIKQKIWDGGASHEEKEGSAADLKKGFTAEMNGSYEGDVFHAAEILIVEVIL